MNSKIVEIFSDKRVLALLLLTLSAVIWVFANGGPFDGGLKYGIDFSGGLRIPVSLEHAVSPAVMQEMVDTIKTRTQTFGLVEVRVTPVGDSEIYVEVPKTNPGLVSDIELLLSKQGVYQGIVDGKVAVTGDSIYSGNIHREDPAYYNRGSNSNVAWVVSFSLTPEGQKHFSQTVLGKSDYPIYMYVDRPEDAVIIISADDLLYNASLTTGTTVLDEDNALKIANQALRLDETPVQVYLLEEQKKNLTLTPATNKTKAYISEETDEQFKEELEDAGFVLVEFPVEEFRPKYRFSASSLSDATIDRWAAVGLKSSPTLSGDITKGLPSRSYVITGGADGDGKQRYENADQNAREIMSVLKGGALPVQISLGSVQEVPATFGKEVLRLSLIGLVFAIFCISIMVAIRYRTPVAVLPIVFTSISEIILLTTIIGFFSIDLAAMAGIIAAVGISVDAQIVITDELLKRKEDEDPQDRLDKAFHIIMTNAAVAIVALSPLLLFSGLVEIIGFATSTAIGYILGVVISRPAYAAIAKRLFYKSSPST